MGDQLMQPQLSRVLGESCGSIIPHQFLLGVNIPSIVRDQNNGSPFL